VSPSCGITNTGTIYCWRKELLGAPKGRFRQISDNGLHACAVRRDGRLVCWGGVSSEPKSVAEWLANPPAGDFSMVSVGFQTACGLTTDGDIHCWGGLDNSARRGPFMNVSTGIGAACAVGTNGELEWWTAWTKSKVFPGRFRTASCQHSMVCGTTAARRAWCWGRGGAYNQHDVPEGLRGVQLVRTSGDFVCALKMNGRVSCWGDAPPAPKKKFRFISEATELGDLCGIATDGKTYCWGNPRYFEDVSP